MSHFNQSQTVHTTFLSPVQYFYRACLISVEFNTPPPVYKAFGLHRKLLDFYGIFTQVIVDALRASLVLSVNVSVNFQSVQALEAISCSLQ